MVTMDILKTFNDDDLRNIGIDKFGPRKKILNSIIPSCHFCRNCFIGHKRFESLGKCPINKYLFWMKTSTTLSALEKSCTTRMKYHYPMFMGGLLTEEFEKEVEEWITSGYFEKLYYDQEIKELERVEKLNSIYECIANMFETLE